MIEVELPRPLVLRLLAYAQQSPHRRVLGLIGAGSGEPRELVPMRNVSPTPQSAAAVDPLEYEAALGLLAARQLRPWASFHSCPQGIAGSADLAVAGLGDGHRLVAALDVRGVLQLRCFEVHEGRIAECRLGLPQ